MKEQNVSQSVLIVWLRETSHESNCKHGRDKTASKTFSQEKIVAITIRKKSIRKIAITSQEQLISGRSKVKLIKNII